METLLVRAENSHTFFLESDDFRTLAEPHFTCAHPKEHRSERVICAFAELFGGRFGDSPTLRAR